MADKHSNKQRVLGQFGQNADKYVSSKEHAHGEDLDLAVTWLEPEAHDCVLDIATGGGHAAKALAPLVHNVMVTDLTESMLETARKHITEKGIKNAQYAIADAEKLPFLNNSFDIVTCRIAPHHFPNPDAFVREAARVLRPNGRFLLIDNVAPNNKALSDYVNLVETIRDPSHFECLSINQWKQLLHEQGFGVKKDRLRKKVHPFQSWVDRMAPTDAHKFAVSSMLLNAPQEARDYFNIVIEKETIMSFSTDQWVALAVKE